MEKTTLLSLVISLLFSTFQCQINAHNKQTLVLDHLYKAKRSAANSPIATSHFKPPTLVNKASVVHHQEDQKRKDKIDRWPGQPYADFDQYGGYVTVNESAGRAFYYYFVEAENSSRSLPLLLWLNGGT
ncbi:putative serine carboxypeptidase-like 53 [Rutidosis leptorrhynchoides]|uniref:putative serine carboxypeptidase-like 53 n=1 Tax=Rutidosis leptorrhynchoides TaxID=125765 RepID=UPI003A9A2D42